MGAQLYGVLLTWVELSSLYADNSGHIQGSTTSQGMAVKSWLLVGACLAGLMAYRYGFQTFPEGAPLSVKMSLAARNVFGDLTDIGCLLGLGDPMILQGKLFDALPINIPVPEGVSTRDVLFDGVLVRIYSPEGVVNRAPAVMYFHGGGWMYGSIERTNGLCGDLAKSLNAIVVSVEYRRAPDHPFPAPLQDCERATLYLLSNAADYGVDPARIAVAGDSAGANLAAALALKLRDTKVQPALKAQVLLYPPLQALDFFTPSYQDWQKSSAVLKKRHMVSMWLYYAQGHIRNLRTALKNNHVSVEVRRVTAATHIHHAILDERLVTSQYVKPEVTDGDAEVWSELEDVLLNPYFSPLMSADASGLPAAFILTCEFDVLRDDGLFYVEKLKSSGVKVQSYYSPSAHHGVMSMPYETPEAIKIKKAMYKFLKSNLRTTT